jgi:hypothetical protein
MSSRGEEKDDASILPPEPRRRKLSVPSSSDTPLHPFIASLEASPAYSLASQDQKFICDLRAHPTYFLASRLSVQRWEVTFRRRAWSHANPQQWNVFGTNMGHRQLRRLVCMGQLHASLVQRLICFKKKVAVLRPLDHVTSILSQRHIVGSRKNQAESLHQDGWRLYGTQRFVLAAHAWAQSALLQHRHSHARLSSLLLEGREGVTRDFKRAFALAERGAALGCPHSKGKSRLNTTTNQ